MCREVGDEVELLEPVLKFWIHCAKLQLAKRATLKKKKKNRADFILGTFHQQGLLAVPLPPSCRVIPQLWGPSMSRIELEVSTTTSHLGLLY